MNKRPFLVVGLASFLSALVCSYGSQTQVAVYLVLAPLSLGAAAMVLRRRMAVTGLWMAAIGTAAVLAMLLCRTAMTVYLLLPFDGQTVRVTARLQEPVSPDQPCIVRVVEGELPKGTMLQVRCERFSGWPEEGDLVRGEMSLRAAFDRESENGRYAKARGIYLYAQTANGVSLRVADGKPTMTPTERAVFGLRRYVRQTLVQYLPKTEAGVCRGITIGDRTALDETVADRFRASGVYHLLAISGLHLSVLTGAVLALLRAVGVRRRLCAALTMAAVVLFMALCGFTASVTRAGVMTCLCLSGGFFHCRADGLNSLGLAAFFMLLCDPFCVWDLGWQLSFAATLGLLTVFPVWQKEVTTRCASLKGGGRAAVWLSEAVGVSLAASLLTLPLTALYFGEVSTVFLIGNLLCVWGGSWLLVVLFAVLLVCPLLPSAAGVLFVAATALCRYVFACTDWLAAWPFALVSSPWYVTAWLFALAAVLPMAYHKGRMAAVVRTGVWMVAVLLVVVAAATVLSHGRITLSAVDTPTPVVLIESEEGHGLVVSGNRDSWKAAQELCDAADIARVEWLLWLPSANNTAPEEGAFTVKVSQLLLGRAVKDDSKLPSVTDTTVLGEGGEMIGGGVNLCVRQGVAMLTVGEETVLICPGDHLVGDLPTAWQMPDVLMVCGDLPPDVGSVAPKQIVVFGKRSVAQKVSSLLPPDAETTYLFESGRWEHTARVR